MPTTLAQTRPTTFSTISPDFIVLCLFSLFGLTISGALLSYVSTETIGTMFSAIG